MVVLKANQKVLKRVGLSVHRMVVPWAWRKVVSMADLMAAKSGKKLAAVMANCWDKKKGKRKELPLGMKKVDSKAEYLVVVLVVVLVDS